jgi:ADP-ribose diphosphatase
MKSTNYNPEWPPAVLLPQIRFQYGKRRNDGGEDMFGKPGFSPEDVAVEKESLLYKGFYKMLGYQLKHRLFGGGWGKLISRELFWRPQAVGVLVYDPAHDLVAMVEQFRIGALDHPVSPWLLEVVAGLVEPGETLEEVAHRELREEAGLVVSRLIPIHDILLSPGGSNERIALYCGVADLRNKGGIFGLPEEGEDILLHVVSRQQAMQALNAGKCDNAPLTIALQWLALHYDGIVAGDL